MNDLAYIIGSNPFGVSRYQRSLLAYWSAVLFEQARQVTDSEGNLMGQAAMQMIERTWETIGGAGLVKQIEPGNSGVANTARIHGGSFGASALIAGSLVEIRSITDTVVIDVLCGAPPGSGNRTDLIYLEVWNEEVQPTISPEGASAIVYKRGNTNNATPLANDLVLVAATESARRVQLRYAIKVAADASSLANLDAGGYAYSAGPAPGQWRAGDGTINAGAVLSAADGYKHAIPLATVARSAGVTTITSGNITTQARLVLLGLSSDRADTYHAASTPAANTLLPLGADGKYPESVFTGLASSASDVDSVDGFHANTTPTANTLLPLSGATKYPNSVLRTGSGQGIDADQVDAIHAAATPAASKLLALDGSAKFPNSALKTGSGQGLAADSVDARHANLTPTANTLLPLDASTKLPNSVWRTGTGNGIDADTVDTYHAASTPAASKLLALDGAAKFPNSALKTGSGQGLDADTVDGSQASAFATSAHASGFTINVQRLSNSAGLGIPYGPYGGSAQTEAYSFPTGKAIGLMGWYIIRGTLGTYTAGSHNQIMAYLQLDENGESNGIYGVGGQQWTSQPDSGAIFFFALPLYGQFPCVTAANYLRVYGFVQAPACGLTITYSRLHLYAWYR